MIKQIKPGNILVSSFNCDVPYVSVFSSMCFKICFWHFSLSKLEVMEELVALIVTEPSPELDDAVKFKYPNIACELLTSDVPQFNELLGDTKVCLILCT